MIINGTNIAMTRGDTESMTVTLDDGIGFVEGDIIELTVRVNPSSSTVELYKKVTEFDQGKARIDIRPEDTEGLIFRSYVYDIQLTRANGGVYTIIKPSTFEILPEVTY